MKSLPVYQRIAEQLAGEIRRGFYADGRLPAERLLATKFQVSGATVAKAMAVLASGGLVERRVGSGTFVLPSPGHRHSVGGSATLGVFLPWGIAGTGGTFFQRTVAQSCLRELQENGQTARLYVGFGGPPDLHGDLLPHDLVEDLRGGRLRGLVGLNGLPGSEVLKLAEQAGVPIVGPETSHWMKADRESIVRRFTKHAIGLGCRRVALLDWVGVQRAKWAMETTLTSNLHEAVQDELRRAGIESLGNLSRFDLHPLLSGAGWDEIMEIWSSAKERPDALIIGDEYFFHDAVAALRTVCPNPDLLPVYAFVTKGFFQTLPCPAVLGEVDGELFGRKVARLLLRVVGQDVSGVADQEIEVEWNDSFFVPRPKLAQVNANAPAL
jgi:DNA-binding LacI/PurR family transcriptional regulator